MDRESINNLKIMVCNCEDLDDIFKNSNDEKLNQLKVGVIKFVKNNNYYESSFYTDESSENDFKILRQDLDYYFSSHKKKK